MKPLKKKVKKIYWRILSLGAKYFYWNPSRKLQVVGVAGTNGKTTTATLLYKVATALGYKAGLISTVEYLIAGEKIQATHTTPDSLSLTKLFKKMADAGCQYAFMEVSSHALDQGRVKDVTFKGGIFANITHDHLDYHGSFERYLEAKNKFFRMLPRGAFALSNADDENGFDVLNGTQAQKIYYGFAGKEDFHGEIKKMDFSGIELNINGNPVCSKLLGKFNAYNLLAVWSACRLLGFDKKKVGEALETVEPPRGRFDYFVTPNKIMVIIDYAHTPDALEKVLKTANDIIPTKVETPTGVGEPQGATLISVFGCGGDRDPLKREKMGRIGAELSDIAIFTSDNPRNEDPEKIIGQMKEDLTPELGKKVITIPNRREAIRE